MIRPFLTALLILLVIQPSISDASWSTILKKNGGNAVAKETSTVVESATQRQLRESAERSYINNTQKLNPQRRAPSYDVSPDGKVTERQAVTKGVGKASNKVPDFVVPPGGAAFPVPKGAVGSSSVVNPGGKTTGSAFTGGKGGKNGQVDTIRIMNPTPARGKNPGYPNGYIKYENKAGQGVDPYTGRTLPNKNSHFPID